MVVMVKVVEVGLVVVVEVVEVWLVPFLDVGVMARVVMVRNLFLVWMKSPFFLLVT